MKRSTLTVTVTAALIGFGLFQLKYTVMSLEQEYKKINTSIRTLNESIHVLKAEWTFLNRPDRLQQLAQKHLDVRPIDGAQLISLKSFAKGSVPFSRETAAAEPQLNELDRLIAQISAGAPEKAGVQ